MPSSLTLRLQHEPDGTAELFARLAKGEFGGASSAWFNIEAIRTFGQQLASTFPIRPGEYIELAGGNWSSDEPRRLSETHVGLRVYPIGSTGVVGLQVQVAYPEPGGGRAEGLSSACAELNTNYEHLRAFGREVEALCLGKADCATLKGDDA